MAGTPNLSQRRKAETRRGILDAAYRVFAQRGYAQATIDDIAAAGGVSKGAVYHHFASKEELFRELLGDHGHEVDAMVAAVSRATSFRDLVRAFLGVWVDHYRADPLFMPLSLEYRVQATREPWAQRLIAEFYGQVRALIGGALRLGQQTGFVRNDLDVEAAATFIFGALDGACFQAAIDPGRVGVDGVEERLTDLVERYVAAKGKGDLRRFRAALAPLVEHSGLRAEPSKETLRGAGR
jgi:AcrR family transcriptional regulator